MARNGRLEFWKKHGGESVALGQVEDRFLPGPGGDVPVRVYAKEQGEARPAAVYFHGGGFVFGNLDSHDAVCRDLADKSGATAQHGRHGGNRSIGLACNREWVASPRLPGGLGIQTRRPCRMRCN